MDGNADGHGLCFNQSVLIAHAQSIASNEQQSCIEDICMVFGFHSSNIPSCFHTALKVNFRYRYEILMKVLSKSNASCAHFSKHILKFLCAKWFMMKTTDATSLSIMQCVTAQNIFFSCIGNVTLASYPQHVILTLHAQDSSLMLKRKHAMFKRYAIFAEYCLLMHLSIQEIISHHLLNNLLHPIIGSTQHIQCISFRAGSGAGLRLKIPRRCENIDVDIIINIMKLQIFTCGHNYYVDLTKFNGRGVLCISKDFQDISVTTHINYHSWSCLTSFGDKRMHQKRIRLSVHSLAEYDCAQTMILHASR